MVKKVSKEAGNKGLAAMGGRKVAIGVLMIAVGVAVEFLGPRGLTDQVSTFLGMIAVGYFGANVIAKGAHAFEAAKVVPKQAEKYGDVEALTKTVKALESRLTKALELVEQDRENAEALVTSLNGVANQNVVIAQTLNKVHQDTSAVANALRQG